jgi:hypothetical protein
VVKVFQIRSMLACALALAGLSACKSKLTYVHLKVLPAAAGEPAPITDIELDLQLSGKSAVVHLSDPGHGTLTLPTDVTLEVKTGSGQLAIVAIARNAAGAEVDRATTTAEVATGSIAEASVQLPGGKPDLQPNEATHDYGTVTDGSASTNVTETFHNDGFKPSGTVGTALGGVGGGNWTIMSDGCSGTTVAPGGSCDVTVEFTPIASGQLAGTLTISANPGGSAVTALTGIGNANPQTLSVMVSGAGSGTIASNPSGISCTSGTCSHAFDWATQVTLTPTPATGSHFSGWTGACSGTGVCSVTANAAASVGGSFALDGETLAVSTAGNTGNNSNTAGGSVSCTVNGGAAGPCPSSTIFGDTVVITATNNPGSTFSSWTGCTSATSQCTLTMDGNKTVTANFTLNVHNVTVTLSGTGGGAITSADSKLNCIWSAGVQSATGCATMYDFGDSIVGSATPDGVSFQSGGGIVGSPTVCSSSPCNIAVVDTDIAISTTFDHNPVPVTVALSLGTGAGSVGDGVASCSNTSLQPCMLSEPYGGNISLTATAAASSHFTTWAAGPCSGATTNPCMITNITSDPAPQATFVLDTETLTVNTTGSGTGTVTCAVNGGANGACPTSVTYGDKVVFTESPGSNSGFASWSLTCDSSTATTCTRNAITANTTMTATFIKTPEALTINTHTGNASDGTGTFTC